MTDLTIISRAPLVREGMTDFGREPGAQMNEEPTTTTTLPWHSRTLSSFTLYGELSIACTSEEFASVRTRLQQEWSVARTFVSKLIGVLLS